MDENQVRNIITRHHRNVKVIHHFETLNECKIAQKLIDELGTSHHLKPTYIRTWIGISIPACDLWNKE